MLHLVLTCIQLQLPLVCYMNIRIRFSHPNYCSITAC